MPFVAACRQGLAAAEAGRIVTFGVAPERAATEYGYINPGEAIAGEVRSVAKFVEKPDPKTAAEYVKAGYLWNSGNFMFRASVLLDEYRNVDADSVQAVTDAVTKAGRDLGFVTLDPAIFGSAKAISIDYAVMEKTGRAAVVPVSCGWSDVGSWHAVWELSDKDAQGNAAQGAAVFEDSRNCNVSTDRALVALEGVDDLVVVATQDAVLVSRQQDANGLKRLVAKLKAVAPEVTEDHIKVHRPWGSYQSVDNGDRHQVKRIIVKPGGRLSLQKHHHRSEHWIVVRGAARVTVNETVKTVHENEFDLYPDRRRPPAGKSRQDSAGTDRGPDRQLSRRGRHHPHRGRLPAVVTDNRSPRKRGAPYFPGHSSWRSLIFLRRTPAPPPFSAMNSTPAVSNAR